MRNLFIGSICFLSLVLCGCTASQIEALNMASESLQRSSDQYQRGTKEMMDNAELPEYKPIIYYQPVGSHSDYMINTDEGIEHVRCIPMSDGTTFCY